MKDQLAQEIKVTMDRFLETVTDDEFVAFLERLDWEHYAALGLMPSGSQFSVSAKPSEDVPPRPWSLSHRSIPNNTATQDRLAA